LLSRIAHEDGSIAILKCNPRLTDLSQDQIAKTFMLKIGGAVAIAGGKDILGHRHDLARLLFGGA